MYRLYLDEVGTDDTKHAHMEIHRYFSLTGVAMRVDHARDDLEPKLNWIKSKVLKHDPDQPIILHRSDIVGRKKQFYRLKDQKLSATFDKAVLRVFETTEYTVMSAMVDKYEMMNQERWGNKHPYHYAMQIMIEKYAQFLERRRSIGDLMPEGRKGKSDKLLQSEFERVRDSGTYFVAANRIQSRIPSNKLKFRYKADNIAGLQLCDLLAHPAHITIREQRGHEVSPGDFCRKVSHILWNHKFDRSHAGKVEGYGVKFFP